MTKGNQNRIMADSGFRVTKESKDPLRLLSLVDKACNMTSEIDHYPTQLCESTCMLHELRGNKLTLSNYCDHFKQRIKSAELAGFDMDGAKYRIALLKRKEVLTGSKTNTEYVNYSADIAKHCNNQYYAML